MAVEKADTVSVESLASAVEAAVKVAAKRHSLTVDKSTFLDRWEIFGRRLRDVTDVKVAFDFASDVAKEINLPGVRAEPVLGRIDRDIWVGFIERGRLPKVISGRP